MICICLELPIFCPNIVISEQEINILFTRIFRIFCSRNFSAVMKYQVGFSALGGDSRVKEEGWGYIAWKVESDS